jgi:16S rRNA (cytosine1402-N4)-methyltransferase
LPQSKPKPAISRGSSGSIDAHVSVLLGEALDGLAVRAGGFYVDATYGRGGHARAIAASGGRVLAIDADADAPQPGDDAIELAHANFRDLGALLDERGIATVDGVLFDFGVSSPQLDEAERGFSFQADGPLDMRLDRTRGERALDLLQTRSERELADIIYGFGEERASYRIARAIVAARERGELRDSTLWLSNLVARAFGGKRGRIHPATRTFQALRIAVNDELGAIEAGLDAAIERTRIGGRIVTIAFHSLEDRIVKRRFREDARLRAITRKPLTAGEGELAANARARSAKLRVAERIEAES